MVKIGTWREWALAVSVLLVLDVIAARLITRYLGDTAYVRQEREYRVRSDVFHHDLAKLTSASGRWGASRYTIHTNSLGFKDASRRRVSLTGETPRVLLMGDSFTEGVGFDFAATYAGIIAEHAAADGVEVLNAAVMSYAPSIYYAKTRYLLMHVGLEFDELVVFLDIADIYDEFGNYAVSEDGIVSARLDDYLPEEGDWFRGFKRLLKHNSVIVYTADAIKDKLVLSLSPPPPPRTDVTRALWTVRDTLLEQYGRTGLQRAVSAMSRLETLLAAHGVALTVAVYPWPDQVAYDSANSRQVVFWREWAEGAGAGFVDLFEPFFESPDRQSTIRSYYLPGDVHFNADGHRLVADAFLRRWRVPASAGVGASVVP